MKLNFWKIIIDKTLQTPLKKAPNKGGKKVNRENTQAWAIKSKLKVGHYGALEQIRFQNPHQS